MDVMIVLLCSRARECRICIRATAEVESKPEVGSSNRTMDGSVRSSLPILTRFFSPPDTMKMAVSAHFSRRSCWMMRLTSANLRSLGQSEGKRRKAVYVN
mmetsp:Transcript_21035/g.49705  ORF Transcript_21035/g.49705 Transcript_21035/m.49705 type:complete len:100 (+) Transcript_21035:2500-2799(+)